jgi:glycosyltransferase involved in cell wall biosynthesis
MSDRAEFEKLAWAANASGAEVIDLQHEFGIWGGTEGEYIEAFLEHCRKPIVSTLHTPNGRNHEQTEILKLLCKKSARLVVLTDWARDAIHSLIPECDAVVIRHGTPDTPYVQPASRKKNKAALMRFISPGFFRPDKGLETILEAFSLLNELGQEFEYHIVGGPQLQFAGQQEYFDRIVALIDTKNLRQCVKVLGEFSERKEMLRHIQECDCGVIGYTYINHSSSGIIPLILACGRPVISTPIEYSREMASVVSGIFLTSGISVEAIADTLTRVIANWDQNRKLMPIIYKETRKWIWKRAAEEYLAVFNGVCA